MVSRQCGVVHACIGLGPRCACLLVRRIACEQAAAGLEKARAVGSLVALISSLREVSLGEDADRQCLACLCVVFVFFASTMC